MNRSSTRWLLALALLGCEKSRAATSQAAAPAIAAPQAMVAAVSDCTADYPQLPLAEMPEGQRAEFCKYASENLCYCGCPHTVGGCLKAHPQCRHAIRASMLALGEIAAGEGTAEAAAKFVSGYYDSFKPENRRKLPDMGFPCLGPADAKITIVEFSDFDCPHCKAARPMVEKLVQEHGLRLCFASLPLSVHKYSPLATAAAMYAAKKGAFWKYHDLLFEDQEARANADEAGYVANLLKLGEKAGLDAEGLKAALQDPRVEKVADELRNFATGLGIQGTPYMFMNGRAVPPFGPELYKLTLDDETEWMANNGKWAAD